MPNEETEIQPVARSGGNNLIPVIENALSRTDVDVDKLSKLLDVYERHQAAEARRAFVEAMNAFRASCPAIEKRGTTVVSKSGHKAGYARLVDAIDTITPHLAANGLSFRFETEQSLTDSIITVTCIVTHVDGHSERSTLSGAPETSGSKNAMQAIGSAVAYLERYTLFAAFGLAASDMDDDGAGANGPKRISDEDMANVIALKDELGDALPGDVFKKWLRDTIGAEDGKIENIPAGKVKTVIAKMEKRRSVS